ncbi:hypothetical protein FWP32_22390 [Vibrio alginolyticus]|nr:hypothetical protein [Vibrio alginolyticus]NNN54529.1 hypothetical protein [Vibrio sp. 2-2(7)]NNN90229.1 hypothetical protein [Vibrio sp. 2-2(9)]EGR0171004.1 hypothetical protein [Vibrio alginolyticus]EGR2557806.1 hypothetical protein [Vibrio alginolyticus]
MRELFCNKLVRIRAIKRGDCFPTRKHPAKVFTKTGQYFTPRGKNKFIFGKHL